VVPTTPQPPQRKEPEPRLDSHDDDPELILYIPFTRVVKLKSINVIGGHAGEGTAPAKIKLCVFCLPAWGLDCLLR
jgi:hypothetical protein